MNSIKKANENSEREHEEDEHTNTTYYELNDSFFVLFQVNGYAHSFILNFFFFCSTPAYLRYFLIH